MFDIALVQLTHDHGICCDVAHVEVRMTSSYTLWVDVIEEIALRHVWTFRFFDSTVYIEFLVSDDKLVRGDVFERDLARATRLYSPIIFAQNKWIGILIQFPVNFRVVDTRLTITIEVDHDVRSRR